MKDPASVDAALAGNALAISALNGGAPLYDQYLQHMKTAKTPEEYYNYLGALGLFPDASLTQRVFDFVLSPAVKNQDLFYLTSALGNYATQPAAWDLFKERFQAINAKAGPSFG